MKLNNRIADHIDITFQEEQKMSERPVITVTGKMPNMQSWYEEKCKRALEELSLLADTIHRPGNEPKRGWPSKQEEIDTHLFNAVRAVLIVTNMSCQFLQQRHL